MTQIQKVIPGTPFTIEVTSEPRAYGISFGLSADFIKACRQRVRHADAYIFLRLPNNKTGLISHLRVDALKSEATAVFPDSYLVDGKGIVEFWVDDEDFSKCLGKSEVMISHTK